MTALLGRSVVLTAALVAATGCKQGSNDVGAAASATAVTAAAAAVATVAAASTTNASSARGDDMCGKQPLRRRCEAGCKAANAQAVTATCAVETRAFSAAVPDKLELGKCLVGCRKPGSDSSCVGAADEAACRCQLACYRSLPPDALEKAKAAERCYARAVAAACE